ncbi:MAG: hypothetical protein IT297_10900, partial [Anaerolineae bacterium]|nr:hypothetical protein [Anaerolineae bacterium]
MMNEELQTIAADLKERFAANLYEFRDEVSLILNPGDIVAFSRALRDE